MADPEFHREGAQSPEMGAVNLLFGIIFPKNYIKMKKCTGGVPHVHQISGWFKIVGIFEIFNKLKCDII